MIPAPDLEPRASRPEPRAHRRYPPRFRGSGASRRCRSAPHVQGGGFLVTARSREIFPDPVRSDTSCRDIVAAPVGGPEPSVVRRAKARRRLERSRRQSLPRARMVTLPSHATTCRARGPAVRSARALRPPRHSHRNGGCDEPRHDPHPLSRARTKLGTVEAHDASAPWTPGTEGRFSRSPAKGVGIGCTRGAFHRWTAMCRAGGLRPLPSLTRRVVHSFSPACGNHMAPFVHPLVRAALTGCTSERARPPHAPFRA